MNILVLSSFAIFGLLAGLFIFFGDMPEAHAGSTQTNPHLFVSAEGQSSMNEVSSGNIIEIAVIDPLISDTDEGKGEPSVEVNGNEVRMAQATDGAWYGYIASVDGARVLDSVPAGVNVIGLSSDFGAFCDEATSFFGQTGFFSETAGFAIARQHNGSIPGVNGTTATTQTFPVCDGSRPIGPLLNNVVREAEDLNCGVGIDNCGQIGIPFDGQGFWPYVQLYDFEEGGNIEIIYNRPGGDEIVTLLFNDPQETLVFDRNLVPQGAQVYLTVGDQALNLDPTDEDHWVAEVGSNQELHYQLFNRDGENRAIDTPVAGADFYFLSVPGIDSKPFDEKLKLDRNAQGGTPQVDCQDNEYWKVIPTATGECLTGNADVDSHFPVAFVEDSSNSAEFINWDDDNQANLIVRHTMN